MKTILFAKEGQTHCSKCGSRFKLDSSGPSPLGIWSTSCPIPECNSGSWVSACETWEHRVPETFNVIPAKAAICAAFASLHEAVMVHEGFSGLSLGKAVFVSQERLFTLTIHSCDYSGDKWPEDGEDIVVKLPGDPRFAYQAVITPGVEINKLRRRVEDRLRKGSYQEIFETANSLGVSITE